MTTLIPQRPRLVRRLYQAGLESLEPRWFFSAYDITGVQAASVDQPQINVLFRNTPTGNPLGGTSPDTGFLIKSYLDTGASGILLSQESGAALGLSPSTFNGQTVEFTDVGVAGGEAFDVSQPIYGALAPSRSLFDGDLPVTDFTQSFGPVRTQLNQSPADFLTGEINIVGMPALQGKVVVMDPTPLNATDISLLDSMKTYVYSPGTAYSAATKTTDPGIPAVNRHVKLSYGNFAKFTTTTPAGAPGPTIASNPFIGPNPVRAAGVVDNTPMIQLAEGTKSVGGSFLLDTGAAASFVSENIAGQLGVHYRTGTFGTDNPILVDASDVPVPNQFQIPIGGIGGSVTAAGFKIDSLTLPTTEGEGIRFIDAPVLVLDVTVEDPITHAQTTLDGDLGMNFLVASVDINGTTLGGGAAGAFDWITFDQTNGILGLNLPDLPPSPPPPPITTATVAGTIFADLNANGVRDSADTGIAGRTVYLDKDSSGSLTAGDVSTTTAADGSYKFANLPSGVSYKVRQVVPTGWTASAPTGGLYTVTPTAGANVVGKDFGTYQLATLKGNVFQDLNANGAKDTGETNLASWTVWLDLNGNGTKDTTDKSALTDASGNYTFTGLKPGAYNARVVVQAGFRQTLPKTSPLTVSLTSGQTLAGQTFAFTKRASVGGFVFNDTSRNGIKDGAEVGLSNWKVYIDANNNGKWETTERFVLSSTTGAWAFGDLIPAKNYIIRVVQQTGWIRTAPAAGYYSITPTNGQIVSGKNFGERK